jgi:bacillithiol biosynthesis deacetylase BshB1
MTSTRDEHDVLIVGAHPDDAEMAMGGTLLKLVRAGHRVMVISLTRGERGTYGSPEERAEEFEAAARLGGYDHGMLDFGDGFVANSPENRLEVMKLIRRFRPRLLFTPYHTNRFGHLDGAAHSDHFTTGTLVRDAVKLARLKNMDPDIPVHTVRRLFYFTLPKDLHPTFIVDVGDVIEDLRKLLRCYRSQMDIERHGSNILDILEVYRRAGGLKAGLKYGEQFLSDEALTPGVEILFEL